MVEFVSYDGKWPVLCSGILVLKIDDETVQFPPHLLKSGGTVWFDKDWKAKIETGAWDVWDDCIPDKYKKRRDEIIEIINQNVPFGCCGGCI